VLTIAALSGFRGRVLFDVEKGGGDPRRVASTTRAAALLGFAPKTDLRTGLGATIAWYRDLIASAT
jgi:GDP-L-fucose synthase